MQKLQLITACALLAGGVSFALTGCSIASHDRNHSGHSQAVTYPWDNLPVSPYPLTNCVVSGKPLGDNPYTFVRTAQEVKLCCKDCLAEFNKTPDHFMAKIP